MNDMLKISNLTKISFLIILSFLISGCAINFKKTPPEEVRKAKQLKQEVVKLDLKLQRLREEKQREIEKLKQVKNSLEQRLRKELAEESVKLDVSERGLVITMLDRVLFDSGKAELKTSSYEILDKVARILNNDLPGKEIGVEGHTDSQPIKYSKWKSNWELSATRALSVLHYFVDERGIDPERLSARGYGPYKPVATDETLEGRQKNRRVEIIILPEISKLEKEYIDEKTSSPYEDIK